MKKIFVGIMIVVILLTISGVVAESSNLAEDIKEKVKEISDKKGITTEGKDVNISKVDFSNLPSEISLENIDDTNLAIYEVVPLDNQSFFVITLSEETFEKMEVPDTYSKLLLNFGFAGKMNESGFLKTSTGVLSGLEKGYVMIGEGSITGISTNLEVLDKNSEEKIEIIIYKNGKEMGFGNSLSADMSEIKNDYDIQSREIVTFRQGDVISAYVKAENVVYKDVITMVELTIRN